jgi:hypothetical protein
MTNKIVRLINRLKFATGLVGLALFTGCAGTAVSGIDQIPTASATATPTLTLPAPATSRPTLTISLTFTPSSPPPTPNPTATLPATPTPSLTPTSTQPPPSATPTPIPTGSPQEHQAAAAPLQEVSPSPPLSRTVRIGLHGRNDLAFHELDYQLIREAGIETLKMMSLTGPDVFARLKSENPDLEFIVRLYDDRINTEGHPSPAEFAAKMIPLLQSLQPYAVKFEVGNEPNHFKRYEGWGADDADAASFNDWFLEVYGLLKAAHPWAELGFPALGTPDSVHRDRAWLELNRAAIAQADWLGVHCYWQTWPDGSSTMFDEARGLCFTYYHEKFPDKALELTEFDNDNVIWGIPPLSPEQLAHEYRSYYQELFNYPYLRSASSFIMSSPDVSWDYFAWRSEAGSFKPVVSVIAQMPRPPLAK